MIFKLHEKDLKERKDWLDKHKKVCPGYGRSVIGGHLTYSFTPTGVGMIIKIKCGCGEKLDLTHVEGW